MIGAGAVAGGPGGIDPFLGIVSASQRLLEPAVLTQDPGGCEALPWGIRAGAWEGLVQRLLMTVDHARPWFAACFLGRRAFLSWQDGAPLPVLLSMLPR